MTDQHPHQPPQPPTHSFPPGMLPPSAEGPVWQGGPGTGPTWSGGSGGGPGWFGRLTARQRTGLLLGGGALTLMLLCCGGLAVVGATAEPSPESRPAAAGARDQGVPEPTVASPSPSTAPTPSDTPSLTPTPTPSPTPVVETRTVTATEKVPHGTRTVKDSSLAEGKRVVRTRGIDGVRTLTYQVTVTDGVQTGRKLVRTAVTRKPVTEVVAVGTRPARRCDPNYSGCVPIASDVDCAGGSGNGPAYLSGVVEVIGDDIYDLDRDNDGLACERD
ncbi:G5 domain-containing protein [Micromonospora cathayae]|uniref:G5 domain-containing protein n=1 Tax=Micromonospora cathayae TaxID=3028804 RepID=A0ABY7ZX37_9ACTN|nr:G5 domain-containing protein [Micromonospora sp. HUAS 3]WDZ86966.1 G5 domain-containing protein [Micromonospora sp. HUAS 3]